MIRAVGLSTNLRTPVEPFPFPSFELLENAEPWLAVFESVNLYDAELRAVRIDLESSQSVEIDLCLQGVFAVAVPIERRAQEYCITVRCTGVSAVHAEDISRQNIVGDYGFDAGASAETRIFWIKGTVGCDLEISVPPNRGGTGLVPRACGLAELER